MRHEMLGTDLHSDLADMGELLWVINREKETHSDSWVWISQSINIQHYPWQALGLGHEKSVNKFAMERETSPLPWCWQPPHGLAGLCLQTACGHPQHFAGHWAVGWGSPGVTGDPDWAQSWLGQEANPLSVFSLHFHFSKELLIILHHLIFFASFIIYLALSHMLHINILKILNWWSF